MAVDAFLKIEGIDGESQQREFEKWIEVSSFSWGVSNAATISGATGGAGAGKAQFQGFNFNTNTSKASPKLMVGCASGQHFQKAQLFVRKAGADQGFVFIKYTLADVLVSSYQTGGTENASPTDQFSLNFGAVEFIWFEQDDRGGAGESVKAGWDLKANKKV
jgi:type VI secretion system secreted protein Hcp